MRCPSPRIASALRRLVAEIENARAEDLRVDQLQRLLISPVLKQTLSAPHDYGMEHEPKFVEGLLEGRRDDVLPDAVHLRGDRVLIRVLLRPKRRPLLVEDAAHEHSVRLSHRRPDCIPHLIVEVWEVPLVRRLHDAVQRYELRCDHFPHRDLLKLYVSTKHSAG